MPFDTVKRVMMVAEQKYKNMFHCWTDLVKRHGITRLWRGSQGSIAKAYNIILGTISNFLRSWASGLALAGFTLLEELVFDGDQLESCKSH